MGKGVRGVGGGGVGVCVRSHFPAKIEIFE